MTSEATTVMASRRFFQANSQPATLLSPSFPASRSNPDKVPDGQTHVQNHGLPCPMKSTANIGRRMTNNTSTRYRARER